MKRKDSLPQLDGKRRLAGIALRNLLFLALGGVSVVLACSPGTRIGGVFLLGSLPLIVIYYCSLRHRATAHPVNVFLVGLFQDLLSGGAVGLWAFLYLLLHAMLVTQPRGLLRFIERSALFSWLGFAFASLLFALLCWLAGWLLLDSRIPPVALALQWGVGALFYSAILLRRPRPPPHPAAQG